MASAMERAVIGDILYFVGHHYHNKRASLHSMERRTSIIPAPRHRNQRRTGSSIPVFDLWSRFPRRIAAAVGLFRVPNMARVRVSIEVIL